MSDLHVEHWGFKHRGKRYDVVKVRGKNREIEVTVSPTGRSVRVYLDGKRMEVTDDE